MTISLWVTGCQKKDMCTPYRYSAALCSKYPGDDCAYLLSGTEDRIVNGRHIYPIRIFDFFKLPLGCMPSCGEFKLNAAVEMIDSIPEMSFELIVVHGLNTETTPMIRNTSGIHSAEYALDLTGAYGNLDEVCQIDGFIQISFKSTGSNSKDEDLLLAHWGRAYVEWEVPTR